MKIHSTQNLNSIRDNNSTNYDMPNVGIRKNNYLNMRMLTQLNKPDMCQSSDDISFKGKKDIVRVFSKAVGKEKWYKRLKNAILDHSFFTKCLDFMEHEVVIQAAISALVCMIMRPATIMALPSKDKKDNMYASSHAFASGVMGILSSILIAMPFSKGVKHLQSKRLGMLKKEILQKMYPQLDLKSIKDQAGKIKPMKEWLDIYGNKFSTSTKGVMMIARPKNIKEISEATLKEKGIDIDLAAMKNKNVNEWVDRQGKKIQFKLEDIILAVKEEGMGGSTKDYKDINFFSLLHIDKKFLKEIMPNLDINSIEKDGKRLYIDAWKDVNGKPFKFNLENTHISSFRETTETVPLYTGAKRQETRDVEKYISYQTNNGIKDRLLVPNKLGSPLTQDVLNADKSNAVANKLLTWLPDLLTRVFVASATIKMIPMILKKGFNLEKHSSKQNSKENEIANNKTIKLETKTEQVAAPRKEVA